MTLANVADVTVLLPVLVTEEVNVALPDDVAVELRCHNYWQRAVLGKSK